MQACRSETLGASEYIQIHWPDFFDFFFQPKYFPSKFILKQTFTVIVSLCLAYFLIFFCLFFICISMS